MSIIKHIRLVPSDLIDPKRRKAIFREAGKTYTGMQDILTDRPGAIAQMMDAAFQAGMKSALLAVAAPASTTQKVWLRDIDVPSMSREIIEHYRQFRVGKTRSGRLPHIADFRFILKPGDPYGPSTLTKDRWIEDGGAIDHSRSNKAVRPLIKMGLLEEVDIRLPDASIGHGAELTEWGFELTIAGKTSRIDDREDGRSSTFDQFQAIRRGEPVHSPEGQISVWDLDHSSAAFVLDHRASGIGRPENLESGPCAEDIAYRLETFESYGSLGRIETWRLYRPNPDARPLFDHAVRTLLEDGILSEWDARTLVVSEWGYELIVTGLTANPDDRVAGRSSTYAQYQTIIGRHGKR